ncbi:hypothetical protein FACS189485_22960 [Spirochaetia bacterium]|nr:hypothetical protein FACS189485_22960 [Spirochaetia bacterium]
MALISSHLNSEGNISAAELPALQEKIQALRDRSLERRNAVDEKRGPGEAAAMGNAVSSDELNELLKGF